MNILYIDIDSLRPDHLGCYGYARDTSPAIDQLAREGIRFDNVYISDAPCLPSRTALWSGRHGFRTGVVGHGGTAAQPFIQGSKRGFYDIHFNEGWMRSLRNASYHTATISSFGERHAAWHWYAGFNDIINPGLGGMERADQVIPVAIDWIERRPQGGPDWFLHVNLWDPHTPYRTPADFKNPFIDAPLPEWLDAAAFQRCFDGYGPHSPQEPNGFDGYDFNGEYALAPVPIKSMSDARAWYDGYDIGVRYGDLWIGRLIHALKRADLYEDMMIIVGADHGENLGELNIWGDHHTADHITCRVPLVVKMPQGRLGGHVDRALHYHFDWAATMIELAGGKVPAGWDGVSFAAELGAGQGSGRDYLVTSQGAWACQRGVRFDHLNKSYIWLVTYHDGYKDLQPSMLFELGSDPFERHNLAESRPDLVAYASMKLINWLGEMMVNSGADVDPLMTVLREGGPFHCRGELGPYLDRLKSTGRGQHADALRARHPREAIETPATYVDETDTGTLWNPKPQME